MIAIFADIHANREAFEACLDDARACGVSGYVLLGDIVGYGADPAWCVERAGELIAAGAPAVLGNHDEAIFKPVTNMNTFAAQAIMWTREQLSTAQQELLAGLPLTVDDGETLYVHADPLTPLDWNYVTDATMADRCLRQTTASRIFCGHVHTPAIYHISPGWRAMAFKPIPGVAVPFLKARRWLTVLGSVGQPRDGSPLAAYSIYDPVRGTVTCRRVAYDIDKAAGKIRAAGLNPRLAARLYEGH